MAKKTSKVSLALMKIRASLSGAFVTLRADAARRQFAMGVIRQGLDMFARASGMDADRFQFDFEIHDEGIIAMFEIPPPPLAPEVISDDAAFAEGDPRVPLMHVVTNAAKEFGMPIEELVQNVIHNIHVWRNPPAETFN